MEGSEKGESSQEKPDKPQQPPTPLGGKDHESPRPGEDSHEQQQQRERKQNVLHKSKIFNYFKNLTAPAVLNWVTFGLFIATGLMFLFTYKLFEQTKEATKNAKLALDETIKQDSLGGLKDSARAVHDSVSLSLQKSVAISQIAALDETKKEFENRNRSYLQMGGLKILVQMNGHVQLTYYIDNLTPNPAKIISERGGDVVKVIPPKNLGMDPVTDRVNTYIIAGSTEVIIATSKAIVDPISYVSLMTGTKFYYYRTEIKYKDLVGGEDRVYSVLLKIQFFNDSTMHDFYIENENTTVK